MDSDGVFRCAGCDAELFSTSDKFESGSGWPSFDRAMAAGTIEEHADRAFGMTRTEIRCANCGGHLGHVFDDGPTDTGLRYCVNSLAVDFEKAPASEPATPTLAADDLRRDVHRTIARVTTDIERYGFNTAVAALMELTNSVYKHVHAGTDAAIVGEAIDTLLELLAPFAPHLAAEAYDQRSGEHVHLRPWPVADASYLKADRTTMVVQVNGKLRDRIEVDAEISEDDATALALASEKVQLQLDGKPPLRIVVRPPNLVNVVA